MNRRGESRHTPRTPVGTDPRQKGAPRYLIVSVHDVTQHCTESVSRILSELEKIGISRTSLLFVPEYHRRGRISQDPDVGAWIHVLARKGHEPVAHGFYHLRERRPKDSFRDRLMTRFYTADEGEFYDLSQFEAERLILEGRKALREAGVSVRGFIAPAWLLSEGAERACREHGFDYTVRFDSVKDLTLGRSYGARSLVYSTRSGWRRILSRIFNPLLVFLTRDHEVLRVSIHPPDLMYPEIWTQTKRLITRALRTRQAITYLEFILLKRAEI